MRREELPFAVDPHRYYEWLKAMWQSNHPEATHEEYEQAMRECARQAGV